MELVNEAYDYLGSGVQGAGSRILDEAVETIIMLLSPFVPHISEELWKIIGKENSIFKVKWPSYEKKAITADVITMVVQVNGKLRSKLEVPLQIEEGALKDAVLSDPRIKQFVEGKTIKKVIIVPKKLVNIVV